MTNLEKESPEKNPEGAETFMGSALRLGRSLLERPISTMRELPGMASDGLKRGCAEVWDAGERISSGSIELAKASVDGVGTFFEAALLGAGNAARSVGRLTDETIDKMAGDPTKTQGLSERGVRIGIGLLPIIGNTQAYGQARAKYRSAEQITDPTTQEQVRHQARRDCLIASTALSLEIATLGLSGKVDLIIKVIGTGLSVLNTGKTVREETEKMRSIPTINLDFISAKADRALEIPQIRDAMDYLLRLDAKEDVGQASNGACKAVPQDAESPHAATPGDPPNLRNPGAPSN